jgi:hypothetical protein
LKYTATVNRMNEWKKFVCAHWCVGVFYKFKQVDCVVCNNNNNNNMNKRSENIFHINGIFWKKEPTQSRANFTINTILSWAFLLEKKELSKKRKVLWLWFLDYDNV